jgi:hypothetical protein
MRCLYAALRISTSVLCNVRAIDGKIFRFPREPSAHALHFETNGHRPPSMPSRDPFFLVEFNLRCKIRDCLVPQTRGALYHDLRRDDLCGKFFTAAPQRLSQASLRELAGRYGINPKTVAKWRRRSSVCDARMGPREPRSTVLSKEEEALIVLPLRNAGPAQTRIGRLPGGRINQSGCDERGRCVGTVIPSQERLSFKACVRR